MNLLLFIQTYQKSYFKLSNYPIPIKKIECKLLLLIYLGVCCITSKKYSHNSFDESSKDNSNSTIVFKNISIFEENNTLTKNTLYII